MASPQDSTFPLCSARAIAEFDATASTDSSGLAGGVSSAASGKAMFGDPLLAQALASKAQLRARGSFIGTGVDSIGSPFLGSLDGELIGFALFGRGFVGGGVSGGCEFPRLRSPGFLPGAFCPPSLALAYRKGESGPQDSA